MAPLKKTCFCPEMLARLEEYRQEEIKVAKRHVKAYQSFVNESVGSGLGGGGDDDDKGGDASSKEQSEAEAEAEAVAIDPSDKPSAPRLVRPGRWPSSDTLKKYFAYHRPDYVPAPNEPRPVLPRMPKRHTVDMVGDAAQELLMSLNARSAELLEMNGHMTSRIPVYLVDTRDEANYCTTMGGLVADVETMHLSWTRYVGQAYARTYKPLLRCSRTMLYLMSRVALIDENPNAIIFVRASPVAIAFVFEYYRELLTNPRHCPALDWQRSHRADVGDPDQVDVMRIARLLGASSLVHACRYHDEDPLPEFDVNSMLLARSPEYSINIPFVIVPNFNPKRTVTLPTRMGPAWRMIILVDFAANTVDRLPSHLDIEWEDLDLSERQRMQAQRAGRAVDWADASMQDDHEMRKGHPDLGHQDRNPSLDQGTTMCMPKCEYVAYRRLSDWTLYPRGIVFANVNPVAVWSVIHFHNTAVTMESAERAIEGLWRLESMPDIKADVERVVRVLEAHELAMCMQYDFKSTQRRHES